MAGPRAESRRAWAIREILGSRDEVEQDPIRGDPLLLQGHQAEAGKVLRAGCRVPAALPDLVSFPAI